MGAAAINLRQGTQGDEQQIDEEGKELRFEIVENEMPQPDGYVQEVAHQFERSGV